MPFRFSKTTILVILFSFPLIALSENFLKDAATLESDSTLINRQIIAKQVTPIRISPPNGYFGLPGAKVSQTALDTTYVISDYKTLPYIFHTQQTWVKVEQVNKELGPNKEIGWAYWGETAASMSENFESYASAEIVE